MSNNTSPERRPHALRRTSAIAVFAALVGACAPAPSYTSCQDDAAACVVEDASGLPEPNDFETGPPLMGGPTGGTTGTGDAGPGRDADLADATDLESSVPASETGMRDSASSITDSDFTTDAVIQPRD